MSTYTFYKKMDCVASRFWPCPIATFLQSNVSCLLIIMFHFKEFMGKEDFSAQCRADIIYPSYNLVMAHFLTKHRDLTNAII
jgi:hypothetical protein